MIYAEIEHFGNSSRSFKGQTKNTLPRNLKELCICFWGQWIWIRGWLDHWRSSEGHFKDILSLFQSPFWFDTKRGSNFRRWFWIRGLFTLYTWRSRSFEGQIKKIQPINLKKFFIMFLRSLNQNELELEVSLTMQGRLKGISRSFIRFDLKITFRWSFMVNPNITFKWPLYLVLKGV